MMKQLIISILFFSILTVDAQDIEVLKFSELQKKILTSDAPLTVFNFWATWCAPCIREIPYFDNYADSPDVEVYLVSLDFVEETQKVRKFVEKKGVKSKVLHLDEEEYQSYLAKVSKEWTGVIPATLFVDKWGKFYFHEQEFTRKELDDMIKGYLN